MSHNLLHPELLTVSELFDHGTVYTVPIYQRNYAWRAKQIEQLISDIQDAMSNGDEQGYFLGNLIVQRTSRASESNFEVVDGQQRLTTLYLLLTFLEKEGESPHPHHKGRLQYESRARATEVVESALHDIRSAVGGIDDHHGAPPAVAALLIEQSDNLLRGDRAWTRTLPPALALPR